MLSVNGYYDGQKFIPLDTIKPNKNQKVIITLLDDFVEIKKNQHFRKFVGKLDDESYHEISEALKDCERVDADEW